MLKHLRLFILSLALSLLFSATVVADSKLNNLNKKPETTAEPKAEESSSPKSTELESTESESIDAITSFVDGNLHFIAYHELGHALVSEFALPVLGREEDAVDRLAIWMMIPEEDKEQPEYLHAAMNGWFASASTRSLDNVAWWGAHGSDEQRAYQIACLLYGWKPTEYKNIADEAELPEDRRASCESESKENDAAWNKVLEEHFSADDAPRATGTVKVTYENSKDFADDAAYLKQLGLLEHLAEIIETYYKIPPGIEVMAGDCGQPNAFWVAGERKLIMCYELVNDFRQMAKKLPQ